MTLGRCPLSIFCSHGTPPREVPRVCGPSTTGSDVVTQFMIGVHRGKWRGVVGELRLGEEVEQDIFAAHVRVHLPHIRPFMCVVLIIRSIHVCGTHQSVRLYAWY